MLVAAYNMTDVTLCILIRRWRVYILQGFTAGWRCRACRDERRACTPWGFARSRRHAATGCGWDDPGTTHLCNDLFSLTGNHYIYSTIVNYISNCVVLTYQVTRCVCVCVLYRFALTRVWGAQPQLTSMLGMLGGGGGGRGAVSPEVVSAAVAAGGAGGVAAAATAAATTAATAAK